MGADEVKWDQMRGVQIGSYVSNEIVIDKMGTNQNEWDQIGYSWIEFRSGRNI